MTSLIRTHPRPARLTLRLRITHALWLWRSRRQLARLTPDRLADLGLSQRDAAQEAARPVWEDVPGAWRPIA